MTWVWRQFSRICSKHVSRVCVWQTLLAIIGGYWAHSVSAAENRSLAAQPGVIRSEFVCEQPGTAVSHASTIVETRAGIMVAWVGASAERAIDGSVWVASYDGRD